MLQTAVHLAHLINDPVRLVRVKNNLAVGYALNNQLQEAHSEHAEVRALMGHLALPEGVDQVFVINHLGVIHLLEGKYSKAIEDCEQALEMLDRMPPEQRAQGPVIRAFLAQALIERGLEEEDKADLQRAERFCAMVWQEVQRTQEQFSWYYIRTLQGRLALEEGHLPQAETLILQGVLHAWEHELQMVVDFVLPYVPEVLLRTGRTALAVELAAVLLEHPLSGPWKQRRIQRIQTTLGEVGLTVPYPPSETFDEVMKKLKRVVG